MFDGCFSTPRAEDLRSIRPDWHGTRTARLGKARRKTAPDETEAVLRARKEYCCGAVYLERILAETEAIHIPHNVIHRILRDNGLASEDHAKQGRRSSVRYERTYSNSMCVIYENHFA